MNNTALPKNNSIPKHVAIIMDGNGRWAKQRGKLRLFGHRNAINAVRNAVSFASKKGIKVLTLFAFSSENWQRPADEVSGLMQLFNWALCNEIKTLCKNGVKVKILGDISRFSSELQDAIQKAQISSAQNTGLTLNIAVNYGGKWDILQSVKKISQDVASGKLTEEQITDDLFSSYLSEPTDVDLLIRTGGEKRISNFLLWQLSYSELFFLDVLWPDFADEHFQEAIDFYASRERRFGCTGDQVRSIK